MPAPDKRDPKPCQAKPDEAAPAVSPAAAERFVEGLLARGEAVPAPAGELPPGATHEITGLKPDGRPEVRRRRFSAR